MARGRVRGKFAFLAGRLVPENDEDRALAEGTRTELLDLVRSYLRIFDDPTEGEDTREIPDA